MWESIGKEADGRTPGRAGFRPWLAVAGGVIGLAAGWLSGADWPDAAVGAGLGFICGGAAPLLVGIWKYLAVFFAAIAAFTWLLVHFLK